MKHTIGIYTIEAIDDNNYTVTHTREVVPAKRGLAESETKLQPTIATDGYYISLPAAVRHVARMLGNNEADLNGWLREYERVLKEFETVVKRYK